MASACGISVGVFPFPWGSSHLEVLAVRAPGVGAEARFPGHWQHVPVGAERPVFGLGSPAARVEARQRGRRGLSRRLGRRGGVLLLRRSRRVFRRRRGSRPVRGLVKNHGHGHLTGPERDNPPDRVIGRDPNGNAVAGDYLDAEAAHPAAQLGQHFMAGITLDTVEAAAVYRHHRALNVYQVVLTQTVINLCRGGAFAPEP